jgi:Leucine-rich repeat (LRR) protein
VYNISYEKCLDTKRKYSTKAFLYIRVILILFHYSHTYIKTQYESNRKNKLTSLPEGVPGKTHTKLKLLHLSSNQLSSLPNSMSQCKALKTIYANGNKIQQLPNDEFLNHLKNLESCNLSNNGIHLLSKEFLERFGQPHATSGECKKVRLIFFMLFFLFLLNIRNYSELINVLSFP